MNLLVKICGVTTPAHVRAAIEAGADAVGIVCCEGSPRTVLDPAPLLEAADASRVPVVAVYRTWHGEPLDGFAAVQAYHFAAAPPIPALHAHRDGPSLPLTTAPTFLGDALLDGPGDGGQGVRADWERAAALARTCRLVLAGGLDPHNVGGAIRRVRPAAVDVSSGVEAAPGRKDPARILAFVTAARQAAQEIA